jgi:hypothetical protein
MLFLGIPLKKSNISYKLHTYSAINSSSIINQSEHILKLSVIHLFGDGKKWREEYVENILLKPYEQTHKFHQDFSQNLTYITIGTTVPID